MRKHSLRCFVAHPPECGRVNAPVSRSQHLTDAVAEVDLELTADELVALSPLTFRTKSQVTNDRKAAQWAFYRVQRPSKRGSGELVKRH